MAPHDLTRIDDAFGNWLAGFTDGEGCFLINRQPSKYGYVYNLSFEMALRIDDRAILDEIRTQTGIGNVGLRNVSAWASSRGGQDHDKARWQVAGRDACFDLTQIFDRYQLRAKKARDYAIWREALMEWRSVPARKGGGKSARDWSTIASLKAQLEEGRRFTMEPYVAPPKPVSPQLSITT